MTRLFTVTGKKARLLAEGDKMLYTVTKKNGDVEVHIEA